MNTIHMVDSIEKTNIEKKHLRYQLYGPMVWAYEQRETGIHEEAQGIA